MGGKPDASAPYPDDLFRLHHGCVAARLLARSRSRNAPRHRRRRIFGNARRHLLRPRPHPRLLCPDAPPVIPGSEPSGGHERRSNIKKRLIFYPTPSINSEKVV